MRVKPSQDAQTMARRGMHVKPRRGEEQELLAGKGFARDEICACRGRRRIDRKMTSHAQTDGETMSEVF